MGFKSFIKRKIKNSNNKLVTIVGKRLHDMAVAFIQSPLGYRIFCSPNMEDEKYICRKYKRFFHHDINLQQPITFNEKNNWRKLYDRQNIYVSMVDKYKVKKIIANKIGSEHTFHLLGVWNSPDEIDFDNLPMQFVLKVNHASGGVIVCRDKSSFNRKKAVKELSRILSTDYFLPSREWPYKNIERCIICEKYMGESLIDYKNYCFNGKLAYTFVWRNISQEDGRKPTPHYCGGYDCNWRKMDIELAYPTCDEVCEKPECHEELVECCEKMSAGIPFVRVDCYIINNHVYVGEMTLFPWGGFLKFKDKKWDRKLGEMLILPPKTVI